MKKPEPYFYGVTFPKPPKRVALTTAQIMLVFLLGSVCGVAAVMPFI